LLERIIRPLIPCPGSEIKIIDQFILSRPVHPELFLEHRPLRCPEILTDDLVLVIVIINARDQMRVLIEQRRVQKILRRNPDRVDHILGRAAPADIIRIRIAVAETHVKHEPAQRLVRVPRVHIDREVHEPVTRIRGILKVRGPAPS